MFCNKNSPRLAASDLFKNGTVAIEFTSIGFTKKIISEIFNEIKCHALLLSVLVSDERSIDVSNIATFETTDSTVHVPQTSHVGYVLVHMAIIRQPRHQLFERSGKRCQVALKESRVDVSIRLCDVVPRSQDNKSMTFSS